MRRRLAVVLALWPAVAAAEPGDLPVEVTFAEHIAPLVFKHCAECHRDGEAAPFPLLTYGDIRKRATMLNQVIQRRYMPPWHAAPGHGEFTNERRLTERELKLFDRWVKTGRKRGDPEREPPVPEFPGGWKLGEPDLVVEMPEPYDVPAEGSDIYRNFVVPLNLDEDRWVTAVEFHPAARTSSHHCVFYLDDTGLARRMDAAEPGTGFKLMLVRTGRLGVWAVGKPPLRLPPSFAHRVRKGSDLVLCMHFHPSGKAERERARVGLHFAGNPPARKLRSIKIPPQFGAYSHIDIPPGVRDYRVFDRFRVPVEVEVFSVWGHAHGLCRTIQAVARKPDGGTEPLLLIRDWNFNWQTSYEYRTPVRLPAGTWIDVTLTYDNSAENPSNPNQPPRRVQYGRETTDEMGTVIFTIAAVRRNEDQKLGDAKSRHRNPLRVGRGLIRRRLLEHDRDRDGTVGREELAARDRPFLEQIDRNGDGRLDAAELDRFELGGDE